MEIAVWTLIAVVVVGLYVVIGKLNALGNELVQIKRHVYLFDADDLIKIRRHADDIQILTSKIERRFNPPKKDPLFENHWMDSDL